MKPLSHSIISSTQSLLGRLTKGTTMGCMLGLALLMATSALAQTSGRARPFKVAGIFTSVPDATGAAGTFKVVGNATHLGKIVFVGDFTVVAATATGLVTVHIHGTYTAANGDTIVVDCPDWVTQYDAGGNPLTSTGLVNIIGGTGRFTHASGSYVGEILPGDPMLFAANGAISY